MNRPFKSPFSYYGSKSKIVPYYPPPTHDLIIEPFAGSAAYSYAYADRDIWINDLDPRTYSIWKFLTSPDALDWVRSRVPDTVQVGQKVSELLDGCPPGLIELGRAEANQSTQGAIGVHDQITSMGARCWKVRRKLEEVIPRIAHWTISNLPYGDIPDMKGTWFIDPPYANAAGSRYRQTSIDYTHLGAWCRTRPGQIIVCENAGASWLPFEPFEHRRSLIKSRYQKADAKEVVWLQS